MPGSHANAYGGNTGSGAGGSVGLPTIKNGRLHLGRGNNHLQRLCGGTGKYRVDPWEYVISANVHRRHLTAEQKREVITALLKADPSKSNRQVAKIAKADDKTVGTVRRELQATAEIPQLEKTIGADGRSRKQPAKREVITALLKADPSKSNRQVAKIAKADDKTVGTVRRELQATAEIPQLEKTIGADGGSRKQPARKSTELRPAEVEVLDATQVGNV